ncbi:MAG: RnfABCDGE type electron transport complex subunit D [Bacteroidetes bacterium]|nr:RnfABCDGE type electron transport complex subunit D [Bacteroidota bacterium]MBL7102983.1 RnfABCDGE type electron transport complex subunit D [Bacteroidales bacterium]
MNILRVSGSPHVHTDNSVNKIMYGVIYAMIPAALVSIYFFGLSAVRVLLISVVACLLVEYLIQKYLLKSEISITDGSAIITGVLLAFNVPCNLPWWIIIIGAIVAIGIGKMSFGGLGKNIFNPALVGRVFLLISFPVQMTSWPVPKPLFTKAVTDAITGPTPLGALKGELYKEGATIQKVMQDGITYIQDGVEVTYRIPSYVDQLLGNMGGSLGEISAIALLIGAIYMLFRKIITWHIPAGYLGSAIIFSGILWLADPSYFIDPLFHLITGGMMLGVFFMATDMVTSPMSAKGQLIFGAGAGILTILIRVFGAYPEGVSFAILIMNAFVPLIDRGFKPKRFGETVKN